MRETGSSSATQNADEDDEKKISRVAAFIFSAYGDRAVEYAQRIEDESAVPDMARRMRMEVERLVQANAPAVETHPVQAIPGKV